MKHKVRKMGGLSEGYTANLSGLFGELSAGCERPLPIAPTHLYAARREPSGGTELSLRNPFACWGRSGGWLRVAELRAGNAEETSRITLSWTDPRLSLLLAAFH